MNELDTALDRCRWSDYESAGSATEHVFALTLYHDDVVQPTLHLLNDKLLELENSDELGADDRHDDYATMYQATVEGYILVVQSMWERGLRNLLIARARHRRLGTAVLEQLKRSTWLKPNHVDLHTHFEELMELPLAGFDSYDDLNLLQLLGNSFRHGDGDSAKRLHDRCPSLWINWLRPGTEIQMRGKVLLRIPDDSPEHPSIDRISLPAKVLEQMIRSVIWFWEDVEYVRLRSMPGPSSERRAKLHKQRLERSLRPTRRVWSPG